jgi:hypothetical protein
MEQIEELRFREEAEVKGGLQERPIQHRLKGQ